ncbi:MAG: gamma carbonic anhydrase family protein [Pseudomonadota bacterium]
MTVYALDGLRPRLPEGNDYWIAPDANVIGDVQLSSGVSIWFGATLRGDTEPLVIGERTSIQENTVIHADPGLPVNIGKNCTIGHKAMIHGCTIGDQTLIGMGATVLNGAVIGKGCLIGAGALVTEGKQIPDGSLVMGMPAKVVRELESAAIEALMSSADVYYGRMQRFRDGLSRID